MMYICNIPNRFDVVQYSTNPAGIHANNMVNIIGIQRIARAVAATGSFGFVFAAGLVDCRLCCHHIVAPISIGRIK